MIKRVLISVLIATFIAIIVCSLGVTPIDSFKDGSKRDIGPPTRSNELTMDMNISEASKASFYGEDDYDSAGSVIAGAGDVNRDGYDDIIIGASGDEEGGVCAGQTYLIFGKANGWSMDTNLSDADASFLGEDADDYSGSSLSGAGDVNGDGYDDILIGASGDEEGGLNAGQTYLIFGKASGWSMDTNLSDADASFLGEDADDYSGSSISGAGDVNGDGYDDILIGAYGNDEKGVNAGQTYLIFGKVTGWSMDTSLSNADASFLGEDANDYSGMSISGAGNVNGDSFDDILIGTYLDDEGGSNAGQTYLIFGKATGWSMDTSLSNADASFLGEDADDSSGWSISGAGDVNGDGFDDIIISAFGDEEAGVQAGQTYLIFGKESGWVRDTNLSSADASFLGEEADDWSGGSIDGVRDVNKDGFDDILIGAYGNGEAGFYTGQVYLILGKTSGWSMDSSLSDADASFSGENIEDALGWSVAGVGDIDGDTYNDFLIGTNSNDESGDGAGQAYLLSTTFFLEPLEIFEITIKNSMGDKIKVADLNETIHLEIIGKDSYPQSVNRARVNVTFSKSEPNQVTISLIETGANTGIYKGTFKVPLRAIYFERIRFSSYIDQSKYYNVFVDYPFRPDPVNSVKVYSDPDLTVLAEKFEIRERAYIKVTGTDSNSLTIDKAFMNLSSDKNTEFDNPLVLLETGSNTGIYVGSFLIPPTMEYPDNITATSSETPSKWARFMVNTQIKLRCSEGYTNAVEDEEYRILFGNVGYNVATWDVSYDTAWLNWDASKHILYGTPNNLQLGKWDVRVNISDGYGHDDELEYQITVMNAEPKILTEAILEAIEDVPYSIDFNSDDDGQGVVTWHLITKSEWLTLDPSTGELSGIPRDYEVGSNDVTVSVDDGNNGWNSTTFNLTVLGINDRPQITTTDIHSAIQGDRYYRDYEVLDPDVDDIHTWSLSMNGTWLTLNPTTGVLEGTPGKWDVGTFLINVTVTDLAGERDSHEFELTVDNINDKPEFTLVPTDIEITHGQLFFFDVDAIDPDPGTTLEYTIRTDPESDMDIDAGTGEIEWVADASIFNSTVENVLEATIKVSDGEAFSLHMFELTIIPTEPPTVSILKPVKGSKTPSTYSLLQWEGLDPENESLIYTIYLDTSESFVSGMRSECMWIEEVSITEYNVTDLQPGTTYYWTVIPFDGCSKGACSNGVFSFKVNNAPTLKSVSDQKASTGSQITIKVSGSDIDTEDRDSLRYYLYETPEGMRINGETGRITWTPSSGQTGYHDVTVKFTDGVDTATVSFEIEVEKGAQQSMLIFLVVGALIIVIVLLVVWIVVSKRKKGEGEKEEAEKVDEESEEIAREMEKHKRELEWEEEHYRPGGSNIISEVPLSAAEAHAQDRDGRPKTDDELYGGSISSEE